MLIFDVYRTARNLGHSVPLALGFALLDWLVDCLAPKR